MSLSDAEEEPQSRNQLSTLMTEMNHLSKIINRLEVSHDKRKLVFSSYAKKNFMQLLDKSNTDQVNAQLKLEPASNSTETQTEMTMEHMDKCMKTKDKQSLELQMQLKILQADYNEIQYQNQKQKTTIEKQAQQIKEMSSKLKAFESEYDEFKQKNSKIKQLMDQADEMNALVKDLKSTGSDRRAEVLRLEKENNLLNTKMQSLIVTYENQIKALHNKLTDQTLYVGELQLTAQKAVQQMNLFEEQKQQLVTQMQSG